MNEKWNPSLTAKKLTVTKCHFSRNSCAIWKIKTGHVETSVYATSVDPQKHRCDPPRWRATRMLIRLAPPGDSVSPRATSVALTWCRRHPVGPWRERSNSTDNNNMRHVVSTSSISRQCIVYPFPARVSISLWCNSIARITNSFKQRINPLHVLDWWNMKMRFWMCFITFLLSRYLSEIVCYFSHVKNLITHDDCNTLHY